MAQSSAQQSESPPCLWRAPSGQPRATAATSLTLSGNILLHAWPCHTFPLIFSSHSLSLFHVFFSLSFLHSHYLFLFLSYPCGFLTYPLIPLMISCKTILTLFWLKRMALPQLYNTAVLHTPTNTVRVHATTDFNIINQTKFPFR